MTIRNKQLRRILEKDGLGFLELERGEGYFYIWSDDPTAKEILSRLPSTAIYTCYFDHLTVLDWVFEIKRIWAKAFLD